MAKNSLPTLPFDKIATLTRVQRFAICIGTFLIMGALFFYLFYLPKLNRLSELEKNFENLEIRIVKAKRDARDLEKYRAQFKEVQGKFRLVLRLLPDKKEIPSLLEAISKSGRHSGLEFLLFQPGKEVKKGFYAEIPVKIEVMGGYHNLAMFFDKVAKLSRIVNVSNINIKQGPSSKKAQTLLKASCVATTYKFVEASKKPATGKKKKKG